MEEKDSFQFTYSAPDQTEIRQIREKYLPKEESKLDRLRQLDAQSTRRGSAVAIAHGIVYALILGTGMSCCLVWQDQWMVPGIVIGCLGLAGAAVTYPLYKHIVEKDRQRLAPEILRLSEELLA